jgi:hypothetical protein
MTENEFDPETCHAIVEADPRLKVAANAVRNDPEQMAEHLAGGMPMAIRQAAVESAAAVVSPIIADRLRRILLHPAATEHWDEAMGLMSNLEIPVDTAVKALDAVAATGGGRAAN